MLNYLTGGGASLLLGLTGWVLAIASRHRGHMRVAGVALGVMNMLLGILTVPFEMLLLILVMMSCLDNIVHSYWSEKVRERPVCPRAFACPPA